MRSLVLLSGGLDSTVMAYKAKMESECARCVFVDYGQRNMWNELHSSMRVAKEFSIPHVQYENKIFGKSFITDSLAHVEHYKDLESVGPGVNNSFVPGRNAALILIAANYCCEFDMDTIWIGCSKDDASNFPDCRSEFIENMRLVIRDSFDKNINLVAPFIDMTKQDIVDYAGTLSIKATSLNMSYSCYSGLNPACGSCHACLLRDSLEI